MSKKLDREIGWAQKLERPESFWQKHGEKKILCDAKGMYLSRFLTKFTLNHENPIFWPWQLIAEGGAPSSDHSLAF